ncbi:malate dehydrogenase [Methanosphaera sp. BMS]|uniref:malate dehydrogenase n=1 Tax=Methanosphaera sp. BMS TaxID=1789762 RepID=UPI000DC1EA9F|nr:malate dehydrogenase [Methanosphaera sp. BMS]AWX32440.1 malate dehydrogenase [Methanosphaera sp. BMS]
MVKITIIGASGTIGKNVAFKLAKEDQIHEIVLFSRKTSNERVKGEIRDMYDALSADNIDVTLTPSYDYEDIRGSEIVLITSGTPRKQGMSRLDLAVPNAKIIEEYARNIAVYAPDCIILIVTNPVDVMTTIALEASGFDKSRVIGLGNHLDSLRLKTMLAKHYNINSGEIHTRVIGEHGDHMVPLLSSTTIGGIPLKYFVEDSDLDIHDLVKSVKSAGNKIISKKGATEYGPAYAISNLIATIVNDSHKILSVSTYLEGEVEGVYDVSLGVPVILCKRGVQTIVPVKMAEDEKLDFFEAARAVKRCTYKIKDVLEL